MRDNQSMYNKSRPTTAFSIKSLKSSIETLECNFVQKDFQEDERKRKYLDHLASLCTSKGYFLRRFKTNFEERPKTSTTKVIFESREKEKLKIHKKAPDSTRSWNEFNHGSNFKLSKHFIVDFNINYESQEVDQSFKIENEPNQQANVEKHLKNELLCSKDFDNNENNFKHNSIDCLSYQLETNVCNLKYIQKPKLKRSITLNSNNEFGKILLESYDIETESKLLMNSTEQILPKCKPKFKFINWNKRGKLLVL
jgi:hypothetical protein